MTFICLHYDFLYLPYTKWNWTGSSWNSSNDKVLWELKRILRFFWRELNWNKETTVRMKQENLIPNLRSEPTIENARPFVIWMCQSWDTLIISDVELKPAHFTYKRIVGVLMYLAVNTRVEIVFSGSARRGRVRDARTVDLMTVKRLLRYSSGTK